MMQRTSVIRHREDTGIDRKKEKCREEKRKRGERKWVMRLHYVFVFSWDKWVSEINEQSPRPKQIKHKSCSHTYAANTVTRLWGKHEFFERTDRGRFIINLRGKMLYLSGITWAIQLKATCVWYLTSQSDHSFQPVTFHHFITYFIILFFAIVMCYLLSIQHHLP